MALSIKYRIVDFLANKLKGISVENGYSFTVGDAVFLKVPNEASWRADAIYPACYIWPDETLSDETYAIDFTQRKMILHVVGINDVTTEPLKWGCDMESDIERALIPPGGAWEPVTGCITQVYAQNAIVYISDSDEFLSGCHLTFRVDYLTSRTDPRTV